MLILNRNEGESITIGDNIVITFLSFNSQEKQIRVGIEAPKSIPVDRTEIYIKKKYQSSKK